MLDALPRASRRSVLHFEAWSACWSPRCWPRRPARRARGRRGGALPGAGVQRDGGLPARVDPGGRGGDPRARGAPRVRVAATEDARAFTDRRLRRYAAVVFLSTTGDVLDGAQQAAFRRYIRRGGGFAGVHAAADTEYGWGWYGRLLGARFRRHPAVQPATIRVVDRRHAVDPRGCRAAGSARTSGTTSAPQPRRGVRVLARLDESTYAGGTMGARHPIAWCRRFDGGRSWYTALGHTSRELRRAALPRAPARRDPLGGRGASVVARSRRRSRRRRGPGRGRGRSSRRSPSRSCRRRPSARRSGPAARRRSRDGVAPRARARAAALGARLGAARGGAAAGRGAPAGGGAVGGGRVRRRGRGGRELLAGAQRLGGEADRLRREAAGGVGHAGHEHDAGDRGEGPEDHAAGHRRPP